MNSTEKMEMQIDESDDGGAVVQLPDSEKNDDPIELSEGGEVSAESNDDNDDNNDDPDRRAIQEARREERRLKKQIHREKSKESNHLINALKKQNQELSNRLAHLEKRTSGAELARVDKAIDDTAVQVEYAKMKMREAVQSQDGDSVVKAQELMYESQRKLESLKAIKDQAARQMSQPPKQNISEADPTVARKAAAWVDRNSWYDPHGGDLDSSITAQIDRKLTEEGYDPSTDDYWDELDDRIKKYLPHKSAKIQDTKRPRSVQTGSGRESAPSLKGNEFRLTPERVKAIKEAGAWDNPERRNRMIQNFKAWDRANKGV